VRRASPERLSPVLTPGPAPRSGAALFLLYGQIRQPGAYAADFLRCLCYPPQ